MALRTIALGVDESEPAADASAWAASMAARTGASLVALHAWQTPFVCTYPGIGFSVEETIAAAQELLRTTIESTGIAVPVETRVERGAAGPALCDESARTDLTVLGATGTARQQHRPEFGEVLFGSTARYVTNHAAGAVAVVPSGARWTDEPCVVVGIDGSTTSLHALQWACEAIPADATIRAVQSIELPHTADDVPIDHELMDPVVGGYLENLKRLVADATSEVQQRVSAHVVVGHSHDALLEPGFQVDLIVMGRHGETAASDKVMGSVSDHTLRHATVPVVIVPPPHSVE